MEFAAAGVVRFLQFGPTEPLETAMKTRTRIKAGAAKKKPAK